MSTPSDPASQRRQQRWQISQPAQLRSLHPVAGEWTDTRIHDLGPHGAFVPIFFSIPEVGTRVQLRWRSIEVEAVVRWMRRVPKGEHSAGVGVEFMEWIGTSRWRFLALYADQALPGPEL